MEHLQWLKQQDTTLETRMQAEEKKFDNYIADHQQELQNNKAAYILPVVVHVVYNGTLGYINSSRVAEQITQTNSDWAGTNGRSMEAFSTSLRANAGITLCLATVDPNGQPTTGIDYKTTTVTSFSTNNGVKSTTTGGANAWDPTKYLNIWVCNLPGYCGYAQFPTSGINSTYGVVIHYEYFGLTGASAPYNLGGTVSHEFGHCFNLYHTWGDDSGGSSAFTCASGTCCSGSDNCTDTPNQSVATSGAHSGVLTDACTSTSPGIMYMNFMDYSDDIDYANMTPNQVTRMQSAVSTYLMSVANNAASACAPPPVPVAAFTASATTVISGTAVTFTDQSTNTPTSWAWVITPAAGWSWAGGSNASTQSPQVLFTTPGTYTVALTATNANGSNTLTKTSYITVTALPAPVADFTATPTTSCSGVIQFTDASTNTPTSWAWNFGDGGTSPLQNPSHTYTASGTYTVSLTATNAQGNNTKTKTAYITINLPTAPVTINDTICGSGTALLSASGSGTLNWYDAASSGTLVNTGTTYSTPSLSATTTYYVENDLLHSPVYVGKADNSGTGGYVTGATNYLIFDCYTPVTLATVDIYFSGAGARTVELRNSSGTILQSTVVTLGTTSPQTVTLNFSIPSGTNLQLGATGSTINLYRNSTGVTFPYTSAGLLSITGASTANRYYYFYNWQIKEPDCSSSRTPVTAIVNSALPASVSITANPTGAICSGTSVTFTATATNGGTTPTYQWKKGGTNITGATNSTYTSTTLATGDIITCAIASNATCVTGSPATSNSITMTVNAGGAASVSIAANPTGSICSGTSVTFTATPTNGGTATYQWKLNGTNITGATNATYTSTTLANNDAMTCVMTSSLSCATGSPATSNMLTMSVSPSVPVSVSIAANPGSSICTGISVTFTATAANGGASPAYQWKKNGTNIGGATTSTYTSSTLTTNDIITCVLTSTVTCGTGSPATSNAITMIVNAGGAASISIAANPTGAICSGTSVTFTATPTNGGTALYQWILNGSNISGATNSTYTSTALANSDAITCVMTSSLSCATGSPATSNSIIMTVDAGGAASVSIVASPSGAICAGTSVTFTATATNGGTPTYQWKRGNANISGATNSTYTSTALANGNVIKCVMTSSLSCATGSPATSNSITMIVNASSAASVSIADNPAGSICAGVNVTYTATATNGGTAPAYQWQLNGTNITGATNSTYTTPALASGDAITCIMTSSLICATGSPSTSNSIIKTVYPNVPVSIAIAASPSGGVCTGTSVIFTATQANGGASPTYQWKKNGTNITGATNSTYTSTTSANGDIITCLLTSNATCATGNPATSNSITMSVNSAQPASVSITSNPSGDICLGTYVTLTATPTNGGTSPTYQWKKNGANISGATNSTYTYIALANGDIITCVMTSNLLCSTGSPATSNSLTITVSSSVAASISIAANPTGAICSGTSVTYTATALNGGSTPVYQWKKNGTNIAGASNSTYTTTALATGDVISCVMTSSFACATGSPATSNSITVTVNSSSPTSVSITANPSGAICSGTSVTYMAIATNGGTPTYQWQLNGSSIVGATNSTYTSTTLTDGDDVTCIMISSIACATGSPATSNIITIEVITPSTASIAIAASPSGSICLGTSVTFTATETNGGTAPTYQWKNNGTNISGATNSTFTSANLVNDDVVTCEMISNASCITGSPAASNSITMNIGSPASASLSISASPAGAVCVGTNITFTAVPVNGGTNPVYQWQVNGSTVGTNSSVYSNSSLANGDIVTCNMTSSAACVNGSPATSNTLTIIINSSVTAGISISAAPSAAVCAGDPITFTATAVNGGSSPIYQWQVNGSNVGANSSVYAGNAFLNGDNVTCFVISSLSCAIGSPASSNIITVAINPAPTTPVITQVSDSLISSPAATYQWYYQNPIGGFSISGAINQVYVPVFSGDYFVIVSDANGCISDSSNVITFIITGITEYSGTEFEIFPNPNQGVFNVKFDSKKYSLATIKLMNALGEVLVERTISKNTTVQINVSGLAQGMYFMRMQTDDETYLEKVIISK